MNFVQLKQASDAEVYIRADQGKLTNKGVIDRANAVLQELEQMLRTADPAFGASLLPWDQVHWRTTNLKWRTTLENRLDGAQHLKTV